MSVRQVEPHMWERIKAGYTGGSTWWWRVGWGVAIFGPTGVYQPLEPISAKPGLRTRPGKDPGLREIPSLVPLPSSMQHFPLPLFSFFFPQNLGLIFWLAFKKLSFLSFFAFFCLFSPIFSIPHFLPVYFFIPCLLVSLWFYMCLSFSCSGVLSHSFRLNILPQLSTHSGMGWGGLRSQFSLGNVWDWVLGLGSQREHRLGNAGSFKAWGLQRQQRAKKSAPFLAEAFACATDVGWSCPREWECVAVAVAAKQLQKTVSPGPFWESFPVIYTTGQSNIKEFWFLLF